MYFYTGPGGATNDSPINSDDDEETVKVRKQQIRQAVDANDDESQNQSKVKEKNENARKSGRANKGKNSRSV